MKVSIIILNWNGKEYLGKCLSSVSKLKKGDLDIEIIVVDNNSTDGSDKQVTRYKNIKILRNAENLGFAEGNNVGIKNALDNGADFVFLLNSDTLVEPELVVKLVEEIQKDQKIGILGTKIYFAPKFEYHLERYSKEELGKVFWFAGGNIDWQNIYSSHRGVDEVDIGQYNQQVETDFITGCGMLIRKEVLEKVGLLDEEYFLYWEDAEFCQRAKKAGWKIVFSPVSKIWHMNAGSSKVGGGLQDYYLTRNRMLFGFKFANNKTKFALIRESLKILISGRPWQKRGVQDFYKRNFGRGSFK